MKTMLGRLASALGLARPEPPAVPLEAATSASLLGELAGNSSEAVEYRETGRTSSMVAIAPRDPKVSFAKLEAEPASPPPAPQDVSNTDAPTNPDPVPAPVSNPGAPKAGATWDALKDDKW